MPPKGTCLDSAALPEPVVAALEVGVDHLEIKHLLLVPLLFINVHQYLVRLPEVWSFGNDLLAHRDALGLLAFIEAVQFVCLLEQILDLRCQPLFNAGRGSFILEPTLNGTLKVLCKHLHQLI